MRVRKVEVLVVCLAVLDLFLQFVLRDHFGFENRVMAFWLPGVIWIIVLIIAWRKKGLGWGLLVAGGGVNLINRIVFSSVWDYIKLPMTNLWLNISDLLITTGVVVLVLGLLRDN